MAKLDKKDHQLLYWLDVNGRASYSELAKKTQMSKQRVKYRIERLEKQGIIKGYYPMIDTARLGLINFRVYLSLRNMTKEKKEALLVYLDAQKPVWAVVQLAGNWDVALGVGVEDITDFHGFWDSLLTEHLLLIAEYQTAIYSPIYHYSKTYLQEDQEPTIRVLGDGQKQEFDEKDVQILQQLALNAREPLINLAEAANLTPEAVSSRLKRLVRDGIIQGYRAMIDVGKLGYHFFKAEIRLASFDKIKAIQQYCLDHPNINQVDRVIGGETIELEFHVKDLQHMLSIIQDLSETFDSCVERFDYLTVLSERKMRYLPELL